VVVAAAHLSHQLQGLAAEAEAEALQGLEAEVEAEAEAEARQAGTEGRRLEDFRVLQYAHRERTQLWQRRARWA